MEVLINAAERGGGWTMLSHMAMKALEHGTPMPDAAPCRKAATKYRIVR
jgi:hypothetical protein